MKNTHCKQWVSHTLRRAAGSHTALRLRVVERKLIRAEGFNTPTFGAVKKGLNPDCNSNQMPPLCVGGICWPGNLLYWRVFSPPSNRGETKKRAPLMRRAWMRMGVGAGTAAPPSPESQSVLTMEKHGITRYHLVVCGCGK